MVSGLDLGITYSAFEHLTEMIIVTDKNSVIEYVNPAVLQKTGYKKSELIGKRCSIFKSGIHPPSFYKQMWDTILSGNTWKGEFLNRKKDGSLYWESSTITPSVNDNNEITHFIAIKQDITQRKKTESILKLQSKVLDNISENIIITDKEGFIKYANKKALQYSLKKGAKPEGIHVSEFFGEKLGNSDITQDEIIAKTLHQGSFEKNFTSYGTGGTRRFFNLRTMKVYDEFDDEDMLVGVTTDMTEIKEREFSIENHKRMFEQILNNIDAIVYVTEIDSYKMLYANAKVCKEFTDDVKGEKCFQVIQNEDNPCNDCRLELKDNLNEYLGKNFCWSKKNSRNNKWYSLHGTAIEWIDGQIVRLIVGLDSTDLINTQYELSRSKKLLDLFFETSMDGFFFMMLDEPVVWKDNIDKDKMADFIFENMRLTKVNKAMLNHYNASEKDLLGHTMKELFSHDVEYGKQICRELMEKRKLKLLTKEITIDGKPIWIEGNYVCLHNEKGEIIGYFGVQRNVTKEKEAEYALRKSEEKFRDLAENIDQIFMLYEKNALTYVSPAYDKITGRDSNILYKNPYLWFRHIYKEDKKKIVSFLKKNFTNQSKDLSIQFRFLTNYSDVRWADAKIYFVYDDFENINKTIILIHDITNEMKLMEKLTQANTDLLRTNKMLYDKSIKDGLTDIFNHQHIVEAVNAEAKRSMRYNKDFSILMLDIDYFKKVNDAYGHATGDIVLKKLAAAINGRLRESDSLGRYGGEEFLIVLPETDLKRAIVVAEKIRKTVEELIFEPVNLKVTVSIGVANFAKEYCGAKDLIDIADDNLYKAKAAGRNRVAY